MTLRQRYPILNYTPHLIIATLCLIIAGAAVLRLLYTTYFPDIGWAGNRYVVIGALIILAAIVVPLLIVTRIRAGDYLWPLLLNLIWLIDFPLLQQFLPSSSSWLIFSSSLWLCGFLYYLIQVYVDRDKQQDSPAPQPTWIGGLILLFAAILPIYLTTMSSLVGTADTFEFQVTVPQLGIVHPTGYPLYLLLGRLWTYLPISNAAWRLNFGTAMYGLLTMVVLFTLLFRLMPASVSVRGPIALLAALYLGITPTFWQQSIAAEVYTLHLLLISLTLLGIHSLFEIGRGGSLWLIRIGVIVSFMMGLALTNHLTSLFLIPLAVVAFLIAEKAPDQLQLNRFKSDFELPIYWRIILAFLLPLSLYLYLPLRWRAVTGEFMTLTDFIDWVSGRRFQGALMPNAWYSDLNRYGIVLDILRDEWPERILVLAAVGIVVLGLFHWRSGVIWLLAMVGYAFYALNYYVPDLEVFLLPTIMLIALFVGIGLWGLFALFNRLPLAPFRSSLILTSLTLVAVDISAQMMFQYPALAEAKDENLQQVQWGKGVFEVEFEEGATILADSEKIAPLYYLQQAEGVRPDLDIAVLPDEAAYRNRLSADLADGTTVYLARYLPQLAGLYQLQAAGPLTEVRTDQLDNLEGRDQPPLFLFGGLELIDYEIRPSAAVDPTQAEIRFIWRKVGELGAEDGPQPTDLIYLRWGDDETDLSVQAQHPVNDLYPLNAWSEGELVNDYYLLPHSYPIATERPVEIGFAPPFTPASEINWHEIATVTLSTVQEPASLQDGHTLFIRNGGVAITEIAYPTQIRPGRQLPLDILGSDLQSLEHFVMPLEFDAEIGEPLEYSLPEVVDLPQGEYRLMTRLPSDQASQGLSCGWLEREKPACPLGEFTISGPRLGAGSINFGDLIALNSIEVDTSRFAPGGSLGVLIEWESLSDQIEDDLTVFLQILDEGDQLIGQIDAKPRQGTRPTNSWALGETISDPYEVPITDKLEPGSYRLILGFYRLSDLKRVPIYDAQGSAIGDFYSYTDLPLIEN